MTNTAVAVLQTPGGCKWSRPGYSVTGVRERRLPESLWVCLRTAARVPIIESDCETCPYWEYQDHRDTRRDVTLRGAQADLRSATVSTARSIHRMSRIETMLRALMVAMAVYLVFVGVTLLTRGLFIPVTIGLWFGALGMAALGILGRLPGDS